MNETLKEFMAGIMETAKDLLVKDKRLQPIAFVLRGNGQQPDILAVDFDDDEEKHKAHFELGVKCLTRQAVAVILINDVAMKCYGKDADWDKVTADPLERPLMYPKSQRTEAILLSCLVFETNERRFLMQPYKDTDGTIEWLTDTLPPDSDMQSHLLDLVADGYKKSGEFLTKLFGGAHDGTTDQSQGSGSPSENTGADGGGSPAEG